MMKVINAHKEKIVLSLIGLSFFIGTWHAFPMLNVVGDEMYYVGGVLRAMEHHTIIPLKDDVPYGTLNYLMSYGVSSLIILCMLPFFGLSIMSLKLYLIQSPTVMYFFLRITSSCFALVFLFLLNKILKKERIDQNSRLFLLLLFFSNIITLVVLHTGKMWVLSTLLVASSFYYLVHSISSSEPDNKNIFRSIILSFLAFSNFPFNIYALISVPILLFHFKNNRRAISKIILYSFYGFIVYVLVTVFNFESIKDQILSIFTVYHPITQGVTNNLNFFASLWSYTLKVGMLFPLSLVTLLLVVKNKIRNKKLFSVSVMYFVVYFFALVLIANWTSDLSSYLRYLFPLSLFLICIIASFNIYFNKSFYIIAGVSIFFASLTLYYLSVPTTYNEAYDWVNSNLNNENILIINEVTDLQLIKNKESSEYTLDKFCSSKCHNIIDNDLQSNFKALVIDSLSKEYNLTGNKQKYYIEEEPLYDLNLHLVASFTNSGNLYHSVDYNIGNYFDLSYFKIKNLGKNIYIYKKT